MPTKRVKYKKKFSGQGKTSSSTTISSLEPTTSKHTIISWWQQIFEALKQAAWKSNLDNCPGLAKEAAYSFILSFFPMLVALIALFFMWGNATQSITEILTTLNRMMPVQSYKIVENYIQSMRLDSSSKIFWFSLIGAIWGASGIMSTLQTAFNKIYQIQSTRSFWKQQLMAIALVFVTGIPLVISTIVTIFGEQLEKLMVSRYGLDFLWQYTWSWLRWVIVLLTVLSMAILLYRVGTEKVQKWRQVLPGAILATTLWLFATLLFNFYVQRFGSYNQVYGSLGAVIVLLIWMFLTSYALLYGAEFNYQLQQSIKPINLTKNQS